MAKLRLTISNIGFLLYLKDAFKLIASVAISLANFNYCYKAELSCNVIFISAVDLRMTFIFLIQFTISIVFNYIDI